VYRGVREQLPLLLLLSPSLLEFMLLLLLSALLC
jgi:hypothetical protein